MATDWGKEHIANPGPHGFSEVLYAFSSAGNNNGIASAGSLARKKITPVGAGTLPTHTPLFVVWLIAVVIIVGALAFLPALALGPLVEHLMLGA